MMALDIVPGDLFGARAAAAVGGIGYESTGCVLVDDRGWLIAAVVDMIVESRAVDIATINQLA